MRVVVHGVGDVGSAVAHMLFRLGCAVVLLDAPAPAHARRGMAFTDALFEGKSALEGIYGKRSAPGAHLEAMLTCGRAIPVLDCELARLLEILAADVLVDARMRKRSVPERERGCAPLTIGLGPNFVAGENVDLVVETQWGTDLGRVIRGGSAAPLAGEPKPIAGRARERYVYAPHAGRIRTGHRIGDCVQAGEVVALLDATPLKAPLAGCLRGLTHSEVVVAAGAKVIEIDPRGDPGKVFGLGERPTRIAEGVATALFGA